MNFKQIRDEAWAIARETAVYDSDRLWTKTEMDRYINRVYRFIAKETKCIRDDITTAICRITVAPYTDYAALQAAAVTDSYAAQDLAWLSDSTSWLYVDPSPAATYAARLDAAAQTLCPYSFPLDYRIVDIDEVKWTHRQWKLAHVSSAKWQMNPWWEQVRGMATEYATDLANNRLNLNFRMTEADTLKLVVRRLPLVDLVDDTDIPEIRIHYHDFMINGILWQMYSKQDSEAYNKDRADQYYALYLKDIDEIKQQETIIHNRLRPNYSVDAFR